MKALLVPEFGNAEVLRFGEIADPVINSHDILVKVKATALNHLDIFVREGISGLKLEMPHILGSDISGEIIEIGSKVESDFKERQRVVIDPGLSCGRCEFCIMGERSLCKKFGIIGEHVRGGNAELFSVSEHNVISIPDEADVDFVQAAAVPLTFMTAWRMVRTQAGVKPSDTVLIIGIGGGVALAALQIAKLSGAKVIVTSSSDQKLKQAYNLGADVAVNSETHPDYHREVYHLTHKRGVDVVIDSVGRATWDRSLMSLRKGGQLVTCGATSGPLAETNINRIFWNQLQIKGSTMASRSEVRNVLKLVWEGKLRPVVDEVFSLSEGIQAHKRLEAGKQFGKIVMKV
ncbi:MAG: zinc-binding dehydrogenase [Candidatus Lokiarchaeota archaeon]|nr:zinc-binding dehydrogenase [Candidatus Lokiarchaeota archaeon]